MKYDWKSNTVICIWRARHYLSATSNTCLQARLTASAVLHKGSMLHPCSALKADFRQNPCSVRLLFTTYQFVIASSTASQRSF